MKNKGFGETQLPDSGIDLDSDATDEFFEMFIEMLLGPEHKDKNIDELTDEQKIQVIQAIAQISGEFHE
ncbi:hypothetical protein [Roseibium sp.]|uniref:hypothetical protein n=1 Tax=Roseibium sp. TaxID=1936156 RepID=UPI003B52889B